MTTYVKKLKLGERESKNLYGEAVRLNMELLENQILLQKGRNEKVELLYPEQFPSVRNQVGNVIKRTVGMVTGFISLLMERYFFVFTDGSWFSHDLGSGELKFFGTEFIWKTFLEPLKLGGDTVSA